MTKTIDSTTDHILRAFQQLYSERKKLAKIVTKEETAGKARDKEILDAASALTAERIVKELADLQLKFDRTAEELANALLAEKTRLDQARRAIEIETDYLQALADTEIAANALDVLVQERQAETQAFEAQSAQQQKSFDQEVAAQREAWQREEQIRQQEAMSYEEASGKERSQAEADFQYDLERKRKMELDKFEADRRKKEQEIAETARARLEDWAERERIIAERDQACDTYRAQIEAFPQQLEQAVEKAREEAFQSAAQEAQVKTDLLDKEFKANQQVRELNIQALQETIARQVEQIAALSADLKEAIKQAQSLASKAIGRTAGAETTPDE